MYCSLIKGKSDRRFVLSRVAKASLSCCPTFILNNFGKHFSAPADFWSEPSCHCAVKCFYLLLKSLSSLPSPPPLPRSSIVHFPPRSVFCVLSLTDVQCCRCQKPWARQWTNQEQELRKKKLQKAFLENFNWSCIYIVLTSAAIWTESGLLSLS